MDSVLLEERCPLCRRLLPKCSESVATSACGKEAKGIRGDTGTDCWTGSAEELEVPLEILCVIHGCLNCFDVVDDPLILDRLSVIMAEDLDPAARSPRCTGGGSSPNNCVAALIGIIPRETIYDAKFYMPRQDFFQRGGRGQTYPSETE